MGYGPGERRRRGPRGASGSPASLGVGTVVGRSSWSVNTVPAGSSTSSPLEEMAPPAPPSSDAHDRPLRAADHLAEDAANGGTDRTLLDRPAAPEVFMNLDDAGTEVDRGAVVEQQAIEGEVEPPAAGGPLGALDHRHRALHAAAVGDDDAPVDVDGAGHGRVEAILDRAVREDSGCSRRTFTSVLSGRTRLPLVRRL